MSADKGGYGNSFFAAVQLATELHKAQVQSLRAELEQERLKNERQEKSIQELNDVIQRMRQALTKAKAKIRSQHDSNTDLRDLIRRLTAANPGLTPVIIPSESTEPSDLSGNELDRALGVHTTPVSVVDPHVSTTTTDPRFNTTNKTASLFSSTPASMAAVLTPLPDDRFITSGPITPVEEEDVEDSKSPESTTSTTASGHEDSDVIIEDIQYPRLIPNRIHLQSGTMALPPNGMQNGSSCGNRIGENNALSRGTSVDEVEILGISTLAEQDRTGNPTTLSNPTSTKTDNDDDEQMLDVNTKERGSTSDSSPSRHVLSRRDVSGRVRYKELEKATNLSSSPATSSQSNPPHVVSPPSSHNDSGSSESSPSILRSSNSFSGEQPSSQEDISPSALGPPGNATRRQGIFTDVVPMKPPLPSGPQIPISDSQLSLDISQTMPPSPELHSTARKDTHCSKEQHNVILPHQIHTFAHDKPPSNHEPVMKPPIPQSLGIGRDKRRRRKPQTVKRITPTQNALNNDLREQFNHNKPPNPNVSTLENIQTNTSLCESFTAQDFVPVTPGLRPVSSMSGKNWACHIPPLNLKESYSFTGGQVAPGLKRSGENGCQMDDGEDVLPRKKAHLLPDAPLWNGHTGKGSLDTSTEDGDVTRLFEREAADTSSEYNPQCYKQAGDNISVGSSVLPSASPTILYDSKGSGVALGMSGPLTTSGITSVSRSDDLPAGNEEGKDQPMDTDEYARALAVKAGLPTYKCVAPMRKKADRDKLDAKACPECQAWYGESDGIHRDRRDHLKHTCRHKDLYLPPDTDDRMWDISFPDSEECERILQK